MTTYYNYTTGESHDTHRGTYTPSKLSGRLSPSSVRGQRIDARYPLPLFLLEVRNVPNNCEGDGYIALQRLAHTYPDLCVIDITNGQYEDMRDINRQMVRSYLTPSNRYCAWSHDQLPQIHTQLRKTPVVVVCACCFQVGDYTFQGRHTPLATIGQQIYRSNMRREVYSLEWPYRTYRQIV